MSPDLGAARALADTSPTPFWLDDPIHRPAPEPALVGTAACDLLVVGGGYAGLWTALLAKERQPGLDVVLLEARTCGWAASGRNGGFCAASLTHGFGNGLARWPAELPTLERLGRENLDGIEATLQRHRIDCDFERTGEIAIANAPWQTAELTAEYEQARALDLADSLTLLDRAQLRAEVRSPLFEAGLWDREGTALVNPARLAWGLRRACLTAGVRLHEHSPAGELTDAEGGALAVRTPHARVRARRLALATNAFPSPLRRVRPYLAPVYDYALVTEPLGRADLDALGWRGRQGLADAGNRFHYFRRTADDRILWGGYDAVYHPGGRIADELDQRPETFARLAAHFQRCFPQLGHLRFTHAWGGVIDTCTRFAPFFGRARGGRVAYAAGFTGLGVGATRFAAQTMLDLLDGAQTERTALEMVRRRPLPFPPEPLKSAGIALTQRSLARADAREGRRDVWLRTLDRLGLGFDS